MIYIDRYTYTQVQIRIRTYTGRQQLEYMVKSKIAKEKKK
jgi:hypothetical protein